jgi:cytochrome c556
MKIKIEPEVFSRKGTTRLKLRSIAKGGKKLDTVEISEDQIFQEVAGKTRYELKEELDEAEGEEREEVIEEFQKAKEAEKVLSDELNALEEEIKETIVKPKIRELEEESRELFNKRIEQVENQLREKGIEVDTGE